MHLCLSDQVLIEGLKASNAVTDMAQTSELFRKTCFSVGKVCRNSPTIVAMATIKSQLLTRTSKT